MEIKAYKTGWRGMYAVASQVKVWALDFTLSSTAID